MIMLNDGVLGCLVVSLLLRTDTTDFLTGLERIVTWRVIPDQKSKKMRALETYLPGLTGKSMEHRTTRPGQHGQRLSSPRKSDYAVQLREKQKLQFNYGLRRSTLLGW